jgi:hypothetical protein
MGILSFFCIIFVMMLKRTKAKKGAAAAAH